MEPESFDAGDLDAMWEARTEQYVNLVKVAGENNLKLFVIKFDPSSGMKALPMKLLSPVGENLSALHALMAKSTIRCNWSKVIMIPDL